MFSQIERKSDVFHGLTEQLNISDINVICVCILKSCQELSCSSAQCKPNTTRQIFFHVLILSNLMLFTELSYTVGCYVSIKGVSVLRELAVCSW